MDRIALIVNPAAGRGRVAKELPRLVEAISQAGHSPTVFATEGRGHATELARAATTEGFDTVVAVGGDGTLNEVVNGLIDNDRPVGNAALGVVTAGSGADFARTFGFPSHAGESLHGIAGDTIPLDIGRLDFPGETGTTVRYFANIAEAGMAASTVSIAERLPRRLGKSRYLVAFWPSLVRFKPCDFTVTADKAAFTGRSHNALVANARYFGGGMHISPHSKPDDGIADLQINVGPKRQALTLIPRIFKGTHLPDDRIVQMSGKTGSIETSRPVPVEADGELVGQTPVTYRILPGVLQLRVGKT